MDKFSFQDETSPPSTGTLLSFLNFIPLKREPQVFLSMFLPCFFMVHNASWGYWYKATTLTGREDNCAISRSLSSTSNLGLILHTCLACRATTMVPVLWPSTLSSPHPCKGVRYQHAPSPQSDWRVTLECRPLRNLLSASFGHWGCSWEP